MNETPRTYRTDGGAERAVYDFPATRIRELAARVKKITTTDEGRLQIVLEGEAVGEAHLEKVRDLLLIQQGEVLVDICGRQGELPV